ncbi:MAG: M20/M25/M40 family metallo-hydrolase [Chthoniobacterales bacterium]
MLQLAIRGSQRVALLTVIAFFGLAHARAQQASAAPSPPPATFSPSTLAALTQLQQAALASDYAYRQVAHLCNNIGPRLSGSAQAEKAVAYVGSELEALGLEVKLEKVMVPHWVRGAETAVLVEFPGMAANTTQKIVLTALGDSVATPPEGLTAEVLVVKDFEELQATPREKVAGRIVVFTHAFDKAMAAQGRGGEAYREAVIYRSEAASAAARLGAVAALIRSVGSADFRLPHTGAMHYADDAPKIPAGALTYEDADLLANLAPQGTLRMHLLLTPLQLPDAESHNVVADLKGSEHPEQVVVVSGHLDSWDLGTGAIDDAAGVAVSMQVANLIRQLKLQPKCTIRIVAWMNEENGLRGGRGYAEAHASELANHVGAIETDGGAGHSLGVNIKGKPELAALLAPIAKALQPIGAGLLEMVQHTGADIGPMEIGGMPTFSPIQDSRTYFHYHHTAADTLDKIIPRELAENAAVNAVLAYALANTEQPLPH